MPSQADHVEVVKLLLGAKADIDAKADNGATALMMAASEGHIDIVKLLLEAKADVNCQRQKWRDSACSLHHRKATTTSWNYSKCTEPRNSF